MPRSRQDQFEKALGAMKDGMPGWVKWVDVAVGLTVDLAAGISDASSAPEKAQSGVSSAIQTIGNETIDLV